MVKRIMGGYLLVLLFLGTTLLAGMMTGGLYAYRNIFGTAQKTLEAADEEARFPMVILRTGAYLVSLLVFPAPSLPIHQICAIAIVAGMIHTLLRVKIENMMLVLGRMRGRSKIIGQNVASEIATGFLIGYLGGIMSGPFNELGKLGGIIGGLAAGLILLSRLGAFFISRPAFKLITMLLSLLRFKTVICSNCLHTTQPHKSRYENGVRYCEHCYSEVNLTESPESGKAVFLFGEIPQPPGDNIYALANPDFEQEDQAYDVSEVYIDTKTCDRRLLERFITYVINYPPTQGARSVKIFYHGELDNLGENLKNALWNNFAQIERCA